MTADDYADWIHGEREEDCCAECGASADEPCDPACPNGETDCGVCGHWGARWIESADGWLCDGCQPLATIHDRCMRGDL